MVNTLFDSNDFMPHGMCYLWQPGVLGLHIASDALITAAYFSIPFTLAHFLRKRRDLEFNWIIGCFAIFIVACGATHLMEIVTIWHPVYWLSGGIKALTAAASVPTAILLVRMMPTALHWPSPATLRCTNAELQLANERLIAEAAERGRVERELHEANQALQQQLSELRRLHELSMQLIQATDLQKVLDEILNATVDLQKADFGTLQLYDDKTRSLRIVAQRGFSQHALDHFKSVCAGDGTVAGRALQVRRRVIVEDVQADTAYAGNLKLAKLEGYRAVQSVPIIARDGNIKGMLSTHFRQAHLPPDTVLQLTDLYVRLAAEPLERAQNEQSLRAARDEADRANQAKSRFLATASHDLRQPVQALSFLNGSLRRMPLPEDAVEAVAQQERSILGMARLLDALLDISKLESGAIKPQIQDFEVAAALEELRTEFASLARDKGLRLEIVNSARSINSDPMLVGQILRNLVSNAIRYTREGSVYLRCREDGPSVRIEVQDTGIGIALEHLPYIFDEFYQVKGGRGTREGHGLGLNIVQRAAKLLGHDLEVRSDVGLGTTFSLSVPVGSRHAEQAPPAMPRPQEGSVRGSPVLL